MYRVKWRPRAEASFLSLAKREQEAIARRIDTLAHTPGPRGCVKMSGYEKTYRIRAGHYRIVYEIHDDVLIVLVVRVGHRRDVYRAE